jgi:hypothetical protein
MLVRHARSGRKERRLRDGQALLEKTLMANDSPVASDFRMASSRNSIFAACVNLEPYEILAFLKSCRRVFDGELVVVVANVRGATVRLIETHGGRVYDVGGRIAGKGSHINFERFAFYRELIETLPADTGSVFLCDIRDIVFQSDPFNGYPAAPLKFFLEEQTIGKCESNSAWIRIAYGQEALGSLSANWISCSGTTLGTMQGIVGYLDRMIGEAGKLLASGRDPSPGIDQGFHNYLIRTGAFPGALIVPNRDGEVQTMHHQREFTLSPGGQALNRDGRLCPVVHQYDRHPAIMHAVMRGNDLMDVYSQRRPRPPAQTWRARTWKWRRSILKRIDRF